MVYYLRLFAIQWIDKLIAITILISYATPKSDPVAQWLECALAVLDVPRSSHSQGIKLFSLKKKEIWIKNLLFITYVDISHWFLIKND